MFPMKLHNIIINKRLVLDELRNTKREISKMAESVDCLRLN